MESRIVLTGRMREIVTKTNANETNGFSVDEKANVLGEKTHNGKTNNCKSNEN